MILRHRVIAVSALLGLVLSLATGFQSGASARPATSTLLGARSVPTLSATTSLGERRFVAAGTSAYVVGVEDGSFPPIGWHTPGQMGGVWAPPIKLLDGLWFRLGGQWLASADQFTSGPGFVQMTFPATGGVQPTLTEFSPDGTAVVDFGLTLTPTGGGPETAQVTLDAHSQVMAAYPWASTTPTADSVEKPDLGSFSAGHLQFQQSGTDWFAEVGASLAPSAGASGPSFWGPTTAADQAAFGSKGTGGELNWRLTIPRGGTTLWVGVAGSAQGQAPALQALARGLRGPDQQLRAKVSERLRVAGQTSIQAPDSGVQQALLWSKLNLADLQRGVSNLQIRDVKAGTAFPAPIATVPFLSGIDAAYPDYAEFFGTDGAYSTYGLAVSGQWQTAIDQLDAMRTVSQIENGNTGKVVHEVNSTGAVYFGDNSDPGDLNETAQFAIAADLIWRWSGDSSVLRDNYTFINEGLHTLVGLDFGGLWPVGDGIVENPSLGGAALDVASETIVALGALNQMAQAFGDRATAAWAASHQSAMLSALGDWWIPSQNLYADSMCTAPNTATGGSCTAAGQLLQQRWWTSVAPMEQAIAPSGRAQAALNQIETPTFTGSCGLFVDGVGGPMGTSGQSCYLVNTGALAVAEANYGQTAQSVANMDKIASQLTVEMPGALPEIAASSQYDPFEAFTSRANVMQAWSSYGLLWTTVDGLLGVVPDAPAGTVSVVPDLPTAWPSLSASDLAVGRDHLGVQARQGGASHVTSVSGAHGLTLTIGVTLPTGTPVGSVLLDGRPVRAQVSAGDRGEVVSTTVRHPAGTETLQVNT